jgi:DNA-binding NarL/FixJ family response regulator
MLRGLSEGKANKEIARDLNIAEPTVKLHMKSLYRKMKVSNRTQAALVARDKGLF